MDGGGWGLVWIRKRWVLGVEVECLIEIGWEEIEDVC